MRYIIGVFCLFAGAVFLSINSVILYRSVERSQHETIEGLALGIAAGFVPWVIAVLPLIVQDTWRRTFFNAWRPTLGTFGVVAMWAAFILYNLTNGAGAIAIGRGATVAQREHDSSTTVRLTDQRATLSKQLAALPKARPSDAVAALVKQEKIKKAFANSRECTDPTTQDQRNTCRTIEELTAEQRVAERSEKLTADIADIDKRLSAAAPVLASADPQAELIQDVTGASRQKIGLWLSASTPIVLEMGAALMWHLGFLVLGINLHAHHGTGGRATEEGKDDRRAQKAIQSPDTLKRPPLVSAEDLTAQRKLAEWFFQTSTRPCADGSLSEEEWYEHYSSICRKSNDKPVPVEAFRRIASRYVPRIQDVAGVTHYQGALPVIPEGA